MNGYRRAVDFMHRIEDRCATQREDWRFGTGYFHERYPTKWDLNFLSVHGFPQPADVPAMIGDADRTFAERGLGHRKIHHDDPSGAELVTPFEAAGWSAETLEIMVLAGTPEAHREIAVEEVSGTEIRPPTQEWYRQTLVVTEEEARNLADSITPLEEAVTTRYFAVRAPRGIVSWCHLYQDGDVAQVEEVSTFERYRGRGYATATVLRAIDEARAAGASFIFLVADANDWPKDMYARHGFRPSGRIYEYAKHPATS